MSGEISLKSIRKAINDFKWSTKERMVPDVILMTKKMIDEIVDAVNKMPYGDIQSSKAGWMFGIRFHVFETPEDLTAATTLHRIQGQCVQVIGDDYTITTYGPIVPKPDFEPQPLEREPFEWTTKFP